VLHLFWLYNKRMSDNHPATISITIRIPAEIAEQMRRLAKTHDRSLNGEIVRALREYAEKHKGEQQP
jgi:predicted transcriptional regulator